MKSQNYGAYAVAVALAFIAALWLGVPAGTLVLLALLISCPLMMILMMRGMHGDTHGQDHSDRGEAHHNKPTR